MAHAPHEIDYRLLGDAVANYRDLGYVYFEAPWIVTPEASKITLPEDGMAYTTVLPDMNLAHLTGSAEQSFINYIIDGELALNRMMVSCTPCFRRGDSRQGVYHSEHFMKVELSFASENYDAAEAAWQTMMQDAAKFMSNFLAEPPIVVQDVATTNEYGNTDLYAPVVNDQSKIIEVGSYGFRCIRNPHTRDTPVYLGYGTGLALPRFNHCRTK